MNQRIRQLAEQAGFKVNWQHEDVQAIKTARFEKFAEVIVEEGISVMKSTVAESIAFERKLDETSSWIESDIKKHFGVDV